LSLYKYLYTSLAAVASLFAYCLRRDTTTTIHDTRLYYVSHQPTHPSHKQS
jgi:hypothetical protein